MQTYSKAGDCQPTLVTVTSGSQSLIYLMSISWPHPAAGRTQSKVWNDLMRKVLSVQRGAVKGASTDSDGMERLERFFVLTLPFMTFPQFLVK